MEDLAPPTFNIPNIQNLSLKNIHAGITQSGEPTDERRYTRFLERYLPASVIIRGMILYSTFSAITTTI